MLHTLMPSYGNPVYIYKHIGIPTYTQILLTRSFRRPDLMTVWNVENCSLVYNKIVVLDVY